MLEYVCIYVLVMSFFHCHSILYYFVYFLTALQGVYVLTCNIMALLQSKLLQSPPSAELWHTGKTGQKLPYLVHDAGFADHSFNRQKLICSHLILMVWSSLLLSCCCCKLNSSCSRLEGFYCEIVARTFHSGCIQTDNKPCAHSFECSHCVDAVVVPMQKAPAKRRRVSWHKS